jgi:hypothetical protein
MEGDGGKVNMSTGMKPIDLGDASERLHYTAQDRQKLLRGFCGSYARLEKRTEGVR